MIIFIMRHGEAEPDHLNDKERALTERGEMQSRQSGIWMSQSCDNLSTKIDLALVSPYKRTQQTVSEVGTELQIEATETCRDIVPSSQPEFALSYIDALAETKSNLNGLLIVSHMPFVSYFLDYVCQHHYSMLFSAGSVAAVRYEPGQGAAKLVGQFLPE